MTEASYDLQKGIRQRLIGTSAVTSLVPADNILDKNRLPEVFPCIILGTDQVMPGDFLARNDYVTHTDLHIWVKEVGLGTVKQIAGAIRQALSDRFYDLESHRIGDLYIESCRYVRDPDGDHAHCILTLSARLVEVH